MPPMRSDGTLHSKHNSHTEFEAQQPHRIRSTTGTPRIGVCAVCAVKYMRHTGHIVGTGHADFPHPALGQDFTPSPPFVPFVPRARPFTVRNPVYHPRSAPTPLHITELSDSAKLTL
jgi:hypothetical protein